MYIFNFWAEREIMGCGKAPACRLIDLAADAADTVLDFPGLV
jgi:hypothetical protein